MWPTLATNTSASRHTRVPRGSCATLLSLRSRGVSRLLSLARLLALRPTHRTLVIQCGNALKDTGRRQRDRRTRSTRNSDETAVPSQLLVLWTRPRCHCKQEPRDRCELLHLPTEVRDSGALSVWPDRGRPVGRTLLNQLGTDCKPMNLKYLRRILSHQALLSSRLQQIPKQA